MKGAMYCINTVNMFYLVSVADQLGLYTEKMIINNKLKLIAICAVLILILTSCRSNEKRNTQTGLGNKANRKSETSDKGHDNTIPEETPDEPFTVEVVEGEYRLNQPIEVLELGGGILVYTFKNCTVIKEPDLDFLESLNFLGDNGKLQSFTEVPENSQLLLLDVSVKNVDSPGASGLEEEFIANAITYGEKRFEGDWDRFLPLDFPYFSKHPEPDQLTESNYYHYKLPKGEEIEFQIGTFLPDEWVEHRSFAIYISSEETTNILNIIIDL